MQPGGGHPGAMGTADVGGGVVADEEDGGGRKAEMRGGSVEDRGIGLLEPNVSET